MRSKILARLKAACRTNETQATAALALSAFNAVLVVHSSDWRLWAFAILLWPSFAFLVNLVDPIPNRQ